MNNKIEKAVKEINSIDSLAARSQWINSVHPLAKLIVTIWYIVTVVSLSKYNIIGILPFVVFPIFIFILGDLSFFDSLKRLKIVLPLVCLIGITNPIFDHAKIEFMDTMINAGIISMLTLIIKGVFTVLASYLLIATTSIEKICYALRLIKAPKIIVTELLLIYRYITVLLQEVHRVTEAYSLRAPNQKGIHFKAWGSLVGSILLRSIERANNVFDSMNMRGYNGEFNSSKNKQKITGGDILFVLIWGAIFVTFKRVPVIIIIGNLVGGVF